MNSPLGRRGPSASAVCALAAALGAGAAFAGDPPPPSGPEAAIRLLEKRAAEDPRDFLTRTLLGGAHARRGRETGDLACYVRAEEAFRDALRLKADHVPASTGLAGALASQHRFREALEAAGGVLAKDAADGGALAVAYDAAMEAGLYPRAAEALAALEKAAPGAPAALARSALWAEVHGAMEKAVERADAAAKASAEAGEDPEARAWYEARAGDLRFHRGDLEGAKARFDAALAIHPTHPAALHGLVAVRRARGDEAGAREILEKVAAAAPTPGVLFDLSEVLAALGKAEEAEKAQDRAVALATREGPWRRTYRREMAEFLVDRGGDPERALLLAREDLEERGDVHGHAVLAWCLHRCGKQDEAAAEMDRAMALGTHEPSFWERAALIRLARGEKEKALELLERVRATGAWFLGDEGRRALESLR